MRHQRNRLRPLALAAVAGAAADLHSRRNCHEHPKLRSQQLRDNRTVEGASPATL
jgi:hypothetical protein